ncbi:MAG: sialidase family protein [Candidatus Promineifilaceae bacterium]
MLKRAKFFTGLLVGLLFLVAFALVFRVQAQTAEQEWSQPVNLSQSGAASQPQTVVSSDSVVHIIWLDAFNGFIHTQGDGENLSAPVQVDLPFGREIILANGNTNRTAYTPLLRADNNNRIHAFWTDDDDALFYSRVIADEFETLASWTPEQPLAEAALAIDVGVAPDGLLHLAYVRPLSTAEFPAGVYYRSSDDGGTTWSTPILLYQSPYFRSLSKEDARVRVQATADGQVIVAWDNRPEERVFIIHSDNRGGTWGEPAEIDHRQNDDLDTAVGPSKISVVDDGDTLHLFWQAGHEALLCAQYHQWSVDGGRTWQPPRRILSEFESCSQENAYVTVPGGLLLVSAFDAGIFSQYWDGSEWGELERHPILTGFSNPSTFRSVDLACRNFVVQDGRVYVVGCDTSNNKDIWELSTSLGNLTRGESDTDLTWSSPELAVEQVEGERSETPILVADADGRLHAMWSQQNSKDSTINYSVSEGAGWSAPIDILVSPGSNSAAENPSAVYHPDGQLMVVWDNGVQGEVYFSHVSAELAGSPAEWFTPELLPAMKSTAGSPDIAVASDGRIFVVYALRLNEDRGVYLVRSEDGGETWSNPFLVFDGVEAGWDAVDDPEITITDDDVLHVLWTQRSFPPENQPISSAYAASTDGGSTWSEALELPFADEPPVWSEISASGFQTLFRVWQEDVDNFSNFWSQTSRDSGLTWEQPVRISDRNNPLGEAALATDGGGRPHLVELTGFSGSVQSDEGASSGVQHWAWSEDGWIPGEGFVTESGTLTNVDGIAAVVAVNGNLSVLYSGLKLDLQTGHLLPGYLASSRSLSVIMTTPTPVPPVTGTTTLEAAASEPATATPQPVVQPTPTIFLPEIPDTNEGFLSTFLGSLGVFGAIVPVGFIVLIIVLVSMRVVRGRRG